MQEDLDISKRKRKGNFKREIESCIIEAQSNAIWTNYIKAKIDNNQKNNQCRLCGESDQTVNHKRMKQIAQN